jgi:hypothetical protein
MAQRRGRAAGQTLGGIPSPTSVDVAERPTLPPRRCCRRDSADTLITVGVTPGIWRGGCRVSCMLGDEEERPRGMRSSVSVGYSCNRIFQHASLTR